VYAPAVTFYTDNVYVHYVDRHIRFVPFSPQYTFRRESQQRSNAIGLVKVYSICTSNFVSHGIVVCAERNQVFSIFIGAIVIVVIVTLHQRFQTRRSADVSVKSYVSKIHLCLAFCTNPREL